MNIIFVVIQCIISMALGYYLNLYFAKTWPKYRCMVRWLCFKLTGIKPTEEQMAKMLEYTSLGLFK